MTRKPKLFSPRAFVALLAAVEFALLSFSGLLLYSAPPCGPARQMGWAILGLSKEQWQAVHLNAGILFCGVALFHIAYNIKPLLHYLRGRLGAARRLRLEPLYAMLCGLLLVLGPAADIPPFRQLGDLGNRLSAAWTGGRTVTCGGEEVGEPAAETEHGQGWGRMTLAELCAASGLDLAAARARLAEQGIQAGPDSPVKPIADRLGIRPGELADRLR